MTVISDWEPLSHFHQCLYHKCSNSLWGKLRILRNDLAQILSVDGLKRLSNWVVNESNADHSSEASTQLISAQSRGRVHACDYLDPF